MVWLNSHYCKSDQFILGSDLEYQEALNYIVDLSEILLWLWIFREHGCRAQHLNGGGGALISAVVALHPPHHLLCVFDFFQRGRMECLQAEMRPEVWLRSALRRRP